MNSQTINLLVQTIVSNNSLTRAGFEQALATPLTQTGTNPYWTFFNFEPPQPWAKGDLRLSTSGHKALLVLYLADNAELNLADLDLQPYGNIMDLRPNPRIPPEGEDAYVYQLNGVQVSIQFTHTTHRLRLIALEWKGQPTTE